MSTTLRFPISPVDLKEARDIFLKVHDSISTALAEKFGEKCEIKVEEPSNLLEGPDGKYHGKVKHIMWRANLYLFSGLKVGVSLVLAWADTTFCYRRKKPEPE